jgi:hypothetical protein
MNILGFGIRIVSCPSSFKSSKESVPSGDSDMLCGDALLATSPRKSGAKFWTKNMYPRKQEMPRVGGVVTSERPDEARTEQGKNIRTIRCESCEGLQYSQYSV